VTSEFVSISPPCARRSSSIAPMIAWLPPIGIGQPRPCAYAASISPAAAVDMLGMGRIAWAATPVSMAGAASSFHRTFQAGEPCSRVRSPNRANVSRCGGGCSMLDPVIRATLSAFRASGPIRFRQASPSAPRLAAVRSMSWYAMPARPPSSGWAYEMSGSTNGMRSASRKRRKNPDAYAIGWTAEHTSWKYPGSVSSSVREPPPIVADRS
jgi:hypothetical protein